MLKLRNLGVLSLAMLLLFTSLSGLAPPPTERALVLGNTPTNSLHGGWMVTYGDTFYWADHSGIYAGETLLTAEPGQHLNVLAGGLYFTVGNGPTTLRRYDLATGETISLLTWAAPIEQLFVTNGGMFLFLSEGRVHRVSRLGNTVRTDEAVFPVVGFIPTPYGTIYAIGTLGDYRLYAGDQLIEAGVTRFFTEDQDLIVRRGTADYQVAFSALFARKGESVALTAYVPRVPAEPRLLALAEADPETCPDWILELSGRQRDTFPLNQVPDQVTVTLSLTASQENIVRRARQQMEIRWTPLEDILGWRGNFTFLAGETYIGIPYAQPINSGFYVPWARSFVHFANAVQDINSPMYTSFSYHGTHATIAPFYGSDCSAFVSYALAQPYRTTTLTFPRYAHRITQSIYSLQVGDVFNAPNHNLIVTAVEFDLEGNLIAVETMEQTLPLPRHRRYGAGGDSGGLQNLVNRTFGSGFALYRSNTVDNVPFTPSPAVNVEAGQRHIITAVAGPGGVISPAGLTPVPRGYDQRFVFHPNLGFGVNRVLVDGVEVEPLREFTFSNVTRDARIEVEFVLTGSPFTDVREGDWFYDAVVYAFQNDLLRGTSATEFSPHQTTTRGMFVTVLARMAGVNPVDYAFPGIVSGSFVNIRTGPSTGHAVITVVPQGTTVDIIGRVGDWYRIHFGGQSAYISRLHVDSQRQTFLDVEAGAFYANYVEWANAMGITTGTGDDRFSPNQTMSRQEMTTLLYRYITAAGILLQDINLPPFADIDTVAPWARAGVTALQRAGVLQGIPGGNFFLPLEPCDRANVAVVIANFHQLYG